MPCYKCTFRSSYDSDERRPYTGTDQAVGLALYLLGIVIGVSSAFAYLAEDSEPFFLKSRYDIFILYPAILGMLTVESGQLEIHIVQENNVAFALCQCR